MSRKIRPRCSNRYAIGFLTLSAVGLLQSGGSALAETAPLRVLQVGEMTVERAAHQATLLNSGKVLITGGCGVDHCNTVHRSAEIYHPASRSFQTIAPMTMARVSHVAIDLEDGEVLIAGGWTGKSATGSAEIFDPDRQEFSPIAGMAAARISPAAVRLADQRVLIIGGEEATARPLTSADLFDPATGQFSVVGEMKTRRGSHQAVLLQDGRVLVTGGHRARGEVLRSAELFDPNTGRFSETGNMAEPRHKHATLLLPDGRVLVIGGSNARDYRGRYTSTEIYDPKTGQFSAGPEMHRPRHKFRDAALTLTNGSILIAGGNTKLERYDPEQNRFSLVEGNLSGPQMFATATRLPTAGVIVLGGYDEQTRPSRSAWLIQTDAE